MATITTGKFVWFEYAGGDAKKAQAFYGELFHWKTQAMPTPDGSSYTMITVGNQTIGGYAPTIPGEQPQAHWRAHVQVQDAAGAAQKIKSLGGKVIKEPHKMGDLGTMGLVADPQGAQFALWQPGKPEGTGDYKGIEGAWCWNELMCDDDEKAVAFYKQVFGFAEDKMSMGDMGTYHLLKIGDKGVGGIMKKPMAQAPTHWLPYVQIASADQTADRAKKLGGDLKVPPTDIPDVGRFAVFVDPQGAGLGVLQPKR
jgi:predicted enzyme related to lactoylglutathione lyase